VGEDVAGALLGEVALQLEKSPLRARHGSRRPVPAVPEHGAEADPPVAARKTANVSGPVSDRVVVEPVAHEHRRAGRLGGGGEDGGEG